MVPTYAVARPGGRRPAARASASALALTVTLVLAGCGLFPPADPLPTDPAPTDPAPTGPELDAAELRLVVDGLTQPVALTHAGDGSGRLFVVQRGGLVRLVSGGELQETPFLDLTSVVGPVTGEAGLLGLAFHPRFPDDPRVFVHYVPPSRRNTIAVLELDDPAAESVPADGLTVLLETPSIGDAHYAGDLAFGLDGLLYATIGDGGVPVQSRDPGTFNGTLLRIGVDETGAEPYLVPSDNPFVGTDGLDEVWAYGLRNPWRFSVDRETGDLWIADVGQTVAEEVNVARPGDPGGQDYGWNEMEGDRCYPPGSTCDPSGITLPVLVYEHEEGRRASVTGGYVYRGEAFPAARGAYVFGDFVRGEVYVAEQDGEGGTWVIRTLLTPGLPIVAFGEDEAGELYVVGFGGTIHALVPGDE